MIPDINPYPKVAAPEWKCVTGETASGSDRVERRKFIQDMLGSAVALSASLKQQSNSFMTIITDPRCTEFRTLGHPEKPARVQRTVDLLKRQKSLQLDWAEPGVVTDSQLLRAHSQEHLDRLNVAESFDGDTSWYPDIANHARRAAAAAIVAARLARSGKPAFSLMRPPGHHATRRKAMGFCYLSTMAIAVLDAIAEGSKRVAVLDFDVHHGNGTEDILRDQSQITFASIHQFPCYPGTGEQDVGSNCFNYPLKPRTPRQEWCKTIQKALERLLATKPELIGVSAGFDAFAHDPLANGTLEREDFHWIGMELRRTGLPIFSVLEGGYSADLPDLVLLYLNGLSGKE